MPADPRIDLRCPDPDCGSGQVAIPGSPRALPGRTLDARQVQAVCAACGHSGALTDFTRVRAREETAHEPRDDHGPFDPDEIVAWAEAYGHPEDWAHRAQAANERAERALQACEQLREDLRAWKGYQNDAIAERDAAVRERDALRKVLAGVEIGYRCTDCGSYLPEAHWTGPWDERYLESQANGDEHPVTPGCASCFHQTVTVPVTATFAPRQVRHLRSVPDAG